MSFYQNPRIVETASGGLPQLEVLPEAAGQTYKAGQLVYSNAGAITAVASDPTYVLGIAQTDASGTTSADAEIQIVQPHDLIEVWYTGGTPSVYKAYGLVVSSNKCKLDVTETTTKVFVVERITDSTNGICLVRPYLGGTVWQSCAGD